MGDEESLSEYLIHKAKPSLSMCNEIRDEAEDFMFA